VISGDIGKLLLVAGLALAAVGGLLLAGSRLGLGRLPGDISGSHGNVSFAFPLGTSLLVSLVLTVVLTIVLRIWR
jgi:Protein of unknown function (DUF2905)